MPRQKQEQQSDIPEIQDEGAEQVKEVKSKKPVFYIGKTENSPGTPSKSMCLAEVWKLEKTPTDKRTPDGTVIHELKEEKLLKTVKILREHLAVHEEQEANTLLRYKEVK